MVSDIVKNNKIPIIIPIIRFEIVLKPSILATCSKVKGKTATINMIKEEKYHNNEYLIGILPFLNTTVVIIARMAEKIIKLILNLKDIIYTSLFQP